MASPSSVSSASYWQYKDDTSYVLKWIDQTARACGWKRQQTKQTTPTPSQATTGAGNPTSNKGTGARANEPTNTKMAATSGRLKGKDRKAAKQHAAAKAAAAIEKQKRDEDERGVVLSSLEILEQANLISSRRPSSADRPPASVMHALCRAIKLRQTFSDWFETTRPDDHKSNLAHRYFIEVLEKIADLLLLQATATATTSSNEADAGEANTGTSKVAQRNRYESLLEQAVQEEPESVPVRPTKSASRTTKADTTASRQKYHMEVKDSQENALMVFALFTDLQDIKAEIKSLWERCFKDGADMVIATVLTAQALAFVQRSEERVIGCRQELVTQEGLPKGAWSYPGTYCRLLSTLCNPTDIQAVRRFEDSSYSSGNEGEGISMNDLTFAFSARRLGYLTRHDSISYCDPLLQEFEHNPRALLNADIEKVIRRDGNLYCTFMDLVKLHYASAKLFQPEQDAGDRRLVQSASQDTLVGALCPVWTRDELNLTSVFAAEIMLDIREICDAFPASRPSYIHLFDSSYTMLGLRLFRESVSDSVVIPTEDSPLGRGGDDEGWLIKVMKILDKVTSMLPARNAAVQDDTNAFCTVALRSTDNIESTVAVPSQEELDVDSTKALDIYRKLDPKAFSYSTDEYRRSRLFKFIYAPIGLLGLYIENNYPLSTTIRQAFMETLIESAGIEVMNVDKHGVGSMAHLYNASRQLGLGNLRWPTMDRIIELHRVALFAGDVPTTPAAMLKSFSHRYWGPKGRMPRKEKMRVMNRAITFMRPSAMTQAYIEHWDTEGRIPYWYTLESNALAEATEKKKKGKKNAAGATNRSFVENMPVVEEYLAAQLRDVRVDYMEVDRVGVHFSRALLEHARGVFGRQANRVVRPEARDGWSDIDFVSEAFEQEAQLHGAVAKCGGDPSRLPPQDCDYLQDSINCLARSLRANGIGVGQGDAGEEAVNTPTSLTRFRIRGSDELPDISRLVLVSHCRCCHRKHYF